MNQKFLILLKILAKSMYQLKLLKKRICLNIVILLEFYQEAIYVMLNKLLSLFFLIKRLLIYQAHNIKKLLKLNLFNSILNKNVLCQKLKIILIKRANNNNSNFIKRN